MKASKIPELRVPKSQSLYLLIDGNAVDKLAEKIYSLTENLNVQCIYTNSPLQPLREASPWLIELLDSQRFSVLAWAQEQNFFENQAAWLFISESNIETTADHFRSLVEVEHPMGHQVVFRLQDPRVARALFTYHAEQNHFELTGPISESWFYVQEKWFKVKSFPQPVNKRKYVLTEQDLNILNIVAMEQFILGLDKHISLYFPHWVAQKKSNTRTIIENAKSRGFTSERAIYFYTNVLGFLGENCLDNNEYQDIQQLVLMPSRLTPEQRIEKAAHLAYQYSQGEIHV
ncbi:DUF4123 domain-containing protein [Vibrio intestinalis]|uniref:DUF4123 domain-containing protein n=1 Tax=Vibrio intestinalis TaxID=2933291 RepID=UPI0021A4EDB6|nr:DUF4123 domain-containing protein [Vibrio intestinalis]